MSRPKASERGEKLESSILELVKQVTEMVRETNEQRHREAIAMAEALKESSEALKEVAKIETVRKAVEEAGKAMPSIPTPWWHGGKPWGPATTGDPVPPHYPNTCKPVPTSSGSASGWVPDPGATVQYSRI